MKEKAGRIIRLAEENQTVPGCTISRQIYQENGIGISVFSLAGHTSISPECYEYHKFIRVLSGSMEVISSDSVLSGLSAGDSYLTPLHMPVGMRTQEGCIYLELDLPKEDLHMNEVLKAGDVFKLADLVPYQEGKIVNMDLASNDQLKFVVMSFDEGTGLSEHAAPGEALVFALDGEAVIGYEGKEYAIGAGETFKFDKLGRHSVKANGRFKMALLLVLE